MDFDYDSLFVLSAVLRTGSFDGAAKVLNVTQSAVSQRIKQLEEKNGALLVVRGRPCVATEEGMLLHEHAEQVILLQHELTRRISEDASGEVTAKVRIGVNNDSLATWFPAVVKRAADEINLRFEIITDDQEFTEERLRSGDALAVVTTNAKPISGCEHFALGALEYLAVATPEFMAQHFANGVDLASLENAPAIAFDQKDSLPLQWMNETFGQSAEFAPHHIPSYEGHLMCCLASVGWAMMPTHTVGSLVEEGTLVELREGAKVSDHLFWQARSKSSSILRLLSNVVKEEAAKQLTNR